MLRKNNRPFQVPEQPRSDVMPEYEIDMDPPETIMQRRRRTVRNVSPKREPLHFEEPYTDRESSPPAASLSESPLTPSKIAAKPKKKQQNKNDGFLASTRPKMIHTQKTRVPIEPGEIGRVRHRTRTTITRTQTPATVAAASTSERIRPRTKNVSYHVFNSEKLPIATFPEEVTAVNNLLKQDRHDENGGVLYLDQVETPEVAVEQTIEFNEPVPTNLIRVRKKPFASNATARRQSPRKVTAANSLSPGRHIIGPGSKVRLVKSGMLVKKKKEEKADIVNSVVKVEVEDAGATTVDVVNEESPQEEPQVATFEDMKQEIIEASPLHELAEISMQHAHQSLFKCEMCSAVFSDRAQLLVHVPVHI